MSSFSELVASRKAWLADVLQPWCRAALRKDLLLAEQEWIDIAGKVDAEKTLWRWAWSRFPELVHESLGIEETTEVVVTLKTGMNASEEELRAFVGEHLAAFKTPVRIAFSSEPLPRNAPGKIMKPQLRAFFD
mgnify:CR=1 FL=1